MASHARHSRSTRSRTRIQTNNNRNNNNVFSTTLDAAALQAHFTRSLNLSLGTKDFTRQRLRRTRNANNNNTNSQQQQQNVPSRSLQQQQERIAQNARNEADRRRRRNNNRQSDFPETTLAQSRGLIKGPKIISEDEWKKIELTHEQREYGRGTEVICPICCDSLGMKAQHILCCSHVFHTDCLESFERFIKSSVDRTCPMCRKPQYQKKKYYRGVKLHRHHSACKIQSYFRGYVCRVKFSKELVKFYGTGAGNRERAHNFFANRVGNATNKLVQHIQRKEDAVDALFAELDQSLAISRSIFGGTEELKDGVRWDNIREQALIRCEENCPICMCNFATTKRKRKKVLLSCTHVFHEKCIEAFENFNSNKLLQNCPVCRSAYTRIEYSISPVRINKKVF